LEIASHKLFAWAGLKLWSSYDDLPMILLISVSQEAKIIGMSHWCPTSMLFDLNFLYDQGSWAFFSCIYCTFILLLRIVCLVHLPIY
jgi:hypothetical protein